MYEYLIEFSGKSSSKPPKSPSRYLTNSILQFEEVRNFFHRGEFIFLTAIENPIGPHYIKFESSDGNFLDKTIDRFKAEDDFQIISKNNDIAFDYPIFEDEIISIQVSDISDSQVKKIKQVIGSEIGNEVETVVNYRIGEVGASGYFINFLIGIGSNLATNKIISKLNDIGVHFDSTSIKIKKAKKFLSKHYELNEDHIFLISHHKKENQLFEVTFDTRRGAKTIVIDKNSEIIRS